LSQDTLCVSSEEAVFQVRFGVRVRGQLRVGVRVFVSSEEAVFQVRSRGRGRGRGRGRNRCRVFGFE